MATWIEALSRTRKSIAGALGRIFRATGRVDAETLEDLESTLLQADLPARLVGEIIPQLEKASKEHRIAPLEALRNLLLRALGPTEPFAWGTSERPFTVLVVGINGSGKTTTSAKLAHLANRTGLKALLGATDTFRAAGSHQLKLWADMVGCDVVAGATGADAAAVAFDAIDAAVARKIDVLIVDTAGRMHTKQPLMDELQKVRRTMGKKLPGAPHETWIVLDASMGQNALAQARVFHDVVPLTGVVISKLDGSAKAGFIFAIAKEMNVPIRFVGLGEGKDDLAPFDPAAFVDGLLGTEKDPAAAH
ncbi:MAG: signal recognition particle-docking protein FtsY [bacterium]